jgi:DegV family protein with EDD domain
MIHIVTDSGSDLPETLLTEYDIKFLPMGVTIGDKSFKDRIDIHNQIFYQMLNTEKVMSSTSQVTPNEFLKCFANLLKDGDAVIYIGFSSRLSGTYQSAFVAKEMLGNLNSKLILIDSKCASMGQGLVAIKAARLVRAGKKLEEIVEEINDYSSKMEHIFVVGSLEMLKRGGRITNGQALIGTLLNVKPILQFDDGYIIPYEKARGFKKSLSILLETLEARGADIEQQTIGISHANNPEIVEELKELISKQYKIKEYLVAEIGPVIGSHAGPGTVALFFTH